MIVVLTRRYVVCLIIANYLCRPHLRLRNQPAAGMPASPVFIVGSPRSGTSSLVDGFLSAGYHGFREGNLLSLLDGLTRQIRWHFAEFAGDPEVLVSQLDAAALEHRIALVFRDAVEALNQAPWIDKTGNPEMIHTLPLLHRLWPDSAFIFAKRRGIENIASRMKKFPNRDFAYHCSDWARNMAAWRTVRETLPPERCIEVDQQDLLHIPTVVALRLGMLVGLTNHGVSVLAATLGATRSEETGFRSAAARHTLESVGWDDAMIEVFRRECGVEMAAYGYTMDERYRCASVAQAVTADA